MAKERVRYLTAEGRLNFLLSEEMNKSFEAARKAYGGIGRTELARRLIADSLRREGWL